MASYYAIDDDAIWSKEAPSTHVSEYFQATVFLSLGVLGFGEEVE
jgi:hypothetical protein